MAEHDENPRWLPPQWLAKAEWMPAHGERPEGVYVKAGGRVGEIVASLRFIGPELDPDLLTELLKCEPTLQYRKGDMRDSKRLIPHRHGTWMLESVLGGTATIDEHIAHLLSRITPEPSAWAQLAHFNPEIIFGLFLSSFNQGDNVSASSAKLLADRGIQLSFDIYSDFRDGR